MIIKNQTISQSKQINDKTKQLFLVCTKCKDKDYIPSIKLIKTEGNLLCVFLNCHVCNHTDQLKLEEYLELMKQLANKTHNCTNKSQHSLAPSNTYCIVCSKWLCIDCNEDHTMYSDLSKHTRISSQVIIETQCQLHQSNQYEYYCDLCDQSLCTDCLQNHKGSKHHIITKTELKIWNDTLNINNMLNQFNSIRGTNQQNLDSMLDSIDNQIQKLTNLKQELIASYIENERQNTMISTLIITLYTNSELLITTPSIELMNNLKHLIVPNNNIFDLSKSKLDDNCLNLIDYYKTNSIIKVIHRIAYSDGRTYNDDWVDDKLKHYEVLKWHFEPQYNEKFKNDMRNDKEIDTYSENNYNETILSLINLIRHNPSNYSQIILNSMKNITSSNDRLIYKTKVKVSLFKGKPTFEKASALLLQMKPMSPLILKKEIAIPLPKTKKEVKNKHYLKQRVQEVKSNEVIDYYFKDLVKEPETSILLMIVDDVENNPGNKRRAVLNPAYKYVGISSDYIEGTFVAYFSFST